MAQAEFQHVAAQARDLGRKMWNVCHFHNLPQWLQDNDFLHTGHRPPLNSFQACFQSIFRIHTETGNIWTHLLGECINIVSKHNTHVLGNIKKTILINVYIF